MHTGDSTSDDGAANRNWKDLLTLFGQTFSLKKATLVIHIMKVDGTVTINLPPPPTDRVWVGFKTPPILDVSLEPSFGNFSLSLGSEEERNLGAMEYGYIHPIVNYVKHTINEAVLKAFVYPNLKDIVIPILGTPSWARKFARKSKASFKTRNS